MWIGDLVSVRKFASEPVLLPALHDSILRTHIQEMPTLTARGATHLALWANRRSKAV